MFSKIKSFFYVDFFIDDFKIIYNFFKNINFFYFFIFLFFLPFVWFFFLIFVLCVFFYTIMYIFIFFKKFFKKYFFKILQNNLIFEYPKNGDFNSFFLIILIFFYITPKKIAFLKVYNFGKNIQNKPKISNFWNFIRFFFSFLVFNIIRLIFFFLTSYNVKVVKLTVQFLDIFKKNLNYKLNSNFVTFSFFLEQTFIDFINLYDFDINLQIENKKIKFTFLGVEFNPPKEVTKEVFNILKEKVNINNNDVVKLQNSIKFVMNNSQLTTSALRTYNELNYEGERKFHTSLEFRVNDDVSIMVRETTKPQIFIKEQINNGVIQNSYMNTGLPSSGSINQDVIAYKTSIIQANNSDIFKVNNTKLLSNMYTGKTNKIDFATKMLSSILEPVYTFDKGNIFKDPKYINFHNKVLNDPIYNNVRNEYLNNLHSIVRIWANHFNIFYNSENFDVVEQVAKFIILDTEYAISPDFLQKLLNL